MDRTEIDILVDSFPEYYNFRGKQKTLNDNHKNALAFCIFLMDTGWGMYTATNKAGQHYNISVRLLRRILKSNSTAISV